MTAIRLLRPAFLALLLASAARAQDSVADDLRAAIEAHDQDGDGRVERSEFGGKAIEFVRLDLDRDGALTPDDVERAEGGGPVDPVPATDGEAAAGPLTEVFETSRDPRTDLLVLAGGDEIRGEFRTGSVGLLTVYGRVHVPAARLAGLDLEVKSGRLDAAVLVNGDRLTGVCLDPIFSFQPSGAAAPISIRREKVLRVVRRVDAAELEGLPSRQCFVMANGDRLCGRLATSGLTLTTLYGSFDLDLARLERIDLAGGERTRTVVHTTDGETLGGFLAPEELQVELDVLAGVDGAEPIALHACRIETFYAREGYRPSTDEPEGSATAWDFEEGPGGWTVSGGETTWFHTRAEAASGKASFECAASGALAYGNMANATLTSPPIDLSALAQPFVSFSRRIQSEEGYDFLRAEVSYDDGMNWQELASFSGDLPWARQEFPLAGGSEKARIRFRFQSDDSEAQRGAWVDNVEIGTR